MHISSEVSPGLGAHTRGQVCTGGHRSGEADPTQVPCAGGAPCSGSVGGGALARSENHSIHSTLKSGQLRARQEPPLTKSWKVLISRGFWFICGKVTDLRGHGSLFLQTPTRQRNRHQDGTFPPQPEGPPPPRGALFQPCSCIPLAWDRMHEYLCHLLPSVPETCLRLVPVPCPTRLSVVAVQCPLLWVVVACLSVWLCDVPW